MESSLVPGRSVVVRFADRSAASWCHESISPVLWPCLMDFLEEARFRRTGTPVGLIREERRLEDADHCAYGPKHIAPPAPPIFSGRVVTVMSPEVLELHMGLGLGRCGKYSGLEQACGRSPGPPWRYGKWLDWWHDSLRSVNSRH